MEENKKVVEMGNVDVTGAVGSGKKIGVFKKPSKKTFVIIGVAVATVGAIATVLVKRSKKDEDCAGSVDQDDFDDSYEADDDSEDEEESEKEEI